MMRRVSTLLLVIGLALLGYVGYQKLTVQQTLTTELAKAKDVVQAEGNVIDHIKIRSNEQTIEGEDEGCPLPNR